MIKISYAVQPLCSNIKTGIGYYSYNLLKNIINQSTHDNYELDFHVFDFLGKNSGKEKIKALYQDQNINIKVNNMIPNGIYLRSQAFFKYFSYEHLFNSKSDITHFFNYLIPRKIRSKTITTIYDMVYKLYPETMDKGNYNLLDKGLERSCKESDLIISISENSKAEIANYMNVPLSKICVVYPAVDFYDYFPQPKEKVNNILKKYRITGDYILYLGTLEPRKNLMSLIKAFFEVKERNKGLKLVLAGNKGWKYQEIFNLVSSLNLSKSVIFTGYVDEIDKPALYSGALIFIFPSYYEGFGMPPLEAMACGVPTIVSNSSSLPEVVGNSGLYINPNYHEDIASKINLLLQDESLRLHLIEEGQKQAQNFSWIDSAKKTLEAYKKLV